MPPDVAGNASPNRYPDIILQSLKMAWTPKPDDAPLDVKMVLIFDRSRPSNSMRPCESPTAIDLNSALPAPPVAPVVPVTKAAPPGLRHVRSQPPGCNIACVAAAPLTAHWQSISSTNPVCPDVQ